MRTYKYDAFGNVLSQTVTLANPYMYTGREWDADTGLYFYRARHYDPKVGRFLQTDPVEPRPDEMNLYVYVMNNPVNFSDPIGIAAVRNDTKRTITATGNRGPGQGSGSQVRITIGPGKTVDKDHPADGVQDVDSVEGRKIPGNDYFPGLSIIECGEELCVWNRNTNSVKRLKDFPCFPFPSDKSPE